MKKLTAEEILNELIERMVDICPYPIPEGLKPYIKESMTIFAAQEVAEATKWISIKERLPDIGQTILSYSADDGIKQTTYRTYCEGSIGYIQGLKECWFEWITHNNMCWRHDATHWQPIPQPPTP